MIARELGISHRTVELHRSHLLEKLGVASVTELLRLKLGNDA
jgi:DNA-binding NarL/FixJ family response regulator